jgi:hypothetical protein
MRAISPVQPPLVVVVWPHDPRPDVMRIYIAADGVLKVSPISSPVVRAEAPSVVPIIRSERIASHGGGALCPSRSTVTRTSAVPWAIPHRTVPRRGNLLRNDEDRVCARSAQPPRVSVDRSVYGATQAVNTSRCAQGCDRSADPGKVRAANAATDSCET